MIKRPEGGPLRQYNEIIQIQLADGIIEEDKHGGPVVSLTYLPHREIIKDQSSTTNF